MPLAADMDGPRLQFGHNPGYPTLLLLYTEESCPKDLLLFSAYLKSHSRSSCLCFTLGPCRQQCHTAAVLAPPLGGQNFLGIPWRGQEMDQANIQARSS
jgi:hypothetical protein